MLTEREMAVVRAVTPRLAKLLVEWFPGVQMRAPAVVSMWATELARAAVEVIEGEA